MSTRQTYSLIFAPSGTCLKEAILKLKMELGNKIEHQDIEETIKKNYRTKEFLTEVNASPEPNFNMSTVIHYLPRSKVKELWEEATKQCFNNLQSSSKPVKILSGHLIYYCGKRDEFYSPINISLFSPFTNKNLSLEPFRVILLVDDIYDMYARLTKEGEIFARTRIGDFIRRLQQEIKLNIKSKQQLSIATMSWIARTLLSLMSWRYSEILLAENIALNLKTEFLVWAVKQLASPIAKYLERRELVSIYLSHPITEARRRKKQKGNWCQFTFETNKLQKIFYDKDCILVMPTGIDELRFHIQNNKYSGYLEERWPLIEKRETKIFYSHPRDTSDISYRSLLRPQYWDTQNSKLKLVTKIKRSKLRNELNAILQVIAREIEFQVSSRDHLLVFHTKGLLVFRPFYGGKADFSGGVQAEVNHWKEIIRLKEIKYAAFVHYKIDVRLMIHCKIRDSKFSITNDFIDIVAKALAGYGITDKNFVKQIVISKGDVKEIEGLLNRMAIPEESREKIKSSFPSIWSQKKKELLESYLTNGVKNAGVFSIWIVSDFNELKKESIQIANFLKSGQPVNNKWQREIDNLLPDSFIS